MSELILHIPHASDFIPKLDGYLVDLKTLEKEILTLTDWYTDELFFCADSTLIKAEFSRVFCDVERFSEDKEEVMAKFGMGVFYERAEDGSLMRNLDKDLKKGFLEKYYWPHHNRLEKAVEDQIENSGKALIVDCHSFPSVPLARDLSQAKDRPDFNIGTDDFHSPKHLVDYSKEFFESRGYSVGIDWPYSGSIVPMKYYKKNKAVQSMMLEVNRALYLEEPTNQKSQNFQFIQELVKEFLANLKNKII